MNAKTKTLAAIPARCVKRASPPAAVMILVAAACLLLCPCGANPAWAQQAANASPPFKSVTASSGRAYRIYVDGKPGTDITANVQKAIDTARAGYGGTVVLPPGSYVVSGTIHLAGSAERFPKGGPQGIALTGAGGANCTKLLYSGPANTAVIDLSGPWGCAVRNLSIDADNKPGAYVGYVS